MEVKVKAKACPKGFGASAPRFGKITMHPNLDSNGLYKVQDKGCDPSLYRPVPIDEVYRILVNKNRIKDVWRFKAEVEDWSKNLGYRNQEILKDRHRMTSVGGPAWHDVREPKRYEPACQNLSFGRAPRFRPSKSFNPPPGTYYKAKPFKAPYGPHSTLPSFEWGHPCRFKNTPIRSLAPNRYHIVDKESIEMKPKKVVSLRGPYDLFTGKRSNSNIKNHFNRSVCSAATWPYPASSYPGSFETYKKSRFGVMNKTGNDKPYRGRNALIDTAMALRLPGEAGPGDLNLSKPKVFKRNAVGFNSSYDHPPLYKKAEVWPAVGRYNSYPISCGILGQGHKHVFLSKAQRTTGAVPRPPMNSF